jgi:signal transduction histidine kinase/CheY-like chemotaxis protein
MPEDCCISSATFTHVDMTAPSTATASTAEALKAQIELSRTRMLIGHVPRASLTVGGFAVFIVLLVSTVIHETMATPLLAWLVTAVVMALLRTRHAIAYLRSANRQAVHWRPGFLIMTTLMALCWAALPWVLPGTRHEALDSTIIGCMIGMAATGASMLGFDRAHTRAWISPVLVSATLYCVDIGGPLGWFGVLSVMGFLVILWLESDRAHRRLGEMLRLRFESEQLAQARAQALHEAESLSAAKSRFLATMSHEMRTPLHGILGLSRMLRGELRSSTGQAQMTLLQNAGEHLLGVINDVLDFSRLKENKLTLKPRPLHLDSLVNDLCELADATARDKGLIVTMQSSLPPEMWVQADPDRLRQILTNLVGNAVKFTPSGHVIVRLKLAEASTDERAVVTFEVEDTGHGIPMDQIDKVFDAFHQADARDERQGGGAGLGLSIAQQICMAMQGEIRCESQPDLGSLFWFALTMPRVAATPTPGIAKTSPAQARQTLFASAFKGSVLIAEDNAVNALVAHTMLEQLGLEVHVVENGKLALEWVTHHPVGLVLMDCHMPEMGGLEATRRIRALEAEQGRTAVPIVAVSAGKYHSDDHRQCLAAGMNDYLSKPFNLEDLVRVLRRHLRRASRTTPGMPVNTARSRPSMPDAPSLGSSDTPVPTGLTTPH